MAWMPPPDGINNAMPALKAPRNISALSRPKLSKLRASITFVGHADLS